MARNKNLLSTRSHRLVMRETVTSYLFLAPFLVFFIMFVLYPMFMCVFTSLFDATMGREDIFSLLTEILEGIAYLHSEIPHEIPVDKKSGNSFD